MFFSRSIIFTLNKILDCQDFKVFYMCVLGLIHVVKNTYNFVKLINYYNPCKAVARKRREAKPTVVPPSGIRHAFYL